MDGKVASKQVLQQTHNAALIHPVCGLMRNWYRVTDKNYGISLNCSGFTPILFPLGMKRHFGDNFNEVNCPKVMH
ncbi:hypothetical protein scyTo_0003544 [Scyliorhinus torazame]|uniref:Uncharacterized protein n=1 Tax=Scyliorhinus torazame TaxID=75743 RepID=A0A401PMS2_SCYTO|nr:hypothetical protein [Scyliorhinus torazame]